MEVPSSKEEPAEETVRNPVCDSTLEIVPVQTSPDKETQAPPPENRGAVAASHASEDWQENEEEPDEDYTVGGYHPVSIGDVYDEQYRVIEKLGWGVYSTVWRCVDAGSSRDIALKIQKSAPEYTNAALGEIEVLKAIQKQHDGQPSKVVELLEHFYVAGPHGNHVCMVFELLGQTLLHVIQDLGPLPPRHVQRIAACLCDCLAFVHDRCGVLHTDIKPENVLVAGNDVKLVDFGTAFFLDKQTARDIQTREYRCPEGILGVWPFLPQADVWSLGCLVFELLTAETLFDPQSPRPNDYFTKDESHLAQAIELLGPIPTDLLRQRTRGKHWFDIPPITNNNQQQQQQHLDPVLRNIAVQPPPPGVDAISQVLQDNFNFDKPAADQVSAFLKPLLQYNPRDRTTAKRARTFPWLCQNRIF